MDGLASVASRYLGYFSVSLAAVAFALGIFVAFGGGIADSRGYIGGGLDEGSVNAYAAGALFLGTLAVGGICAASLGVEYARMKMPIAGAAFVATIPITYSAGIMLNSALAGTLGSSIAVSSSYRGAGYESTIVGLSCALASAAIIIFFFVRRKGLERHMLICMCALFDVSWAVAYMIPQEIWYAKLFIVVNVVPLIIMYKREKAEGKHSELFNDASRELARVKDAVSHAKSDGVFIDAISAKLREAEGMIGVAPVGESGGLARGAARAIALGGGGFAALLIAYTGVMCFMNSGSIFEMTDEVAIGLVGAMIALAVALVAFRPSTGQPAFGLGAGFAIGLVAVILYSVAGMMPANIVVLAGVPAGAVGLAVVDKRRAAGFYEKVFGNGVAFFFCAIAVILVFIAVQITSYAVAGDAETAVKGIAANPELAAGMILACMVASTIAIAFKLYREAGKGGIVAVGCGAIAVVLAIALFGIIGVGAIAIGVCASVALVMVVESGLKSYDYFGGISEERKKMRSLGDNERFTRAKDIALGAEKELGEVAVRFTIAVAALNRAVAIGKDADRFGFKSDIKLDGVRALMKDGKYIEAETSAKDIEAGAKDTIEKHDIAIDAISIAQSAVENARRLGADYAGAHEILVKALESVDKFMFVDAKGLAEDAKRIADEKAEAFKSASGAIANATGEIELAKNTGADVAAASELLARANAAMDAHDYENARKLGVEAEEHAKKTSEVFTKAVSLIAAAQAEVAVLKKAGCDATKAEDLLAKATLAMEYNEYDNATKYASDSASEARAMLDKFGRAGAAIKAAEELFASLKGRGIDTTRLALFLKQAKAEMQATEYERALDYDKAINLATQCIDEGKKTEESYNNAVEARTQAAEMLAKMKEQGIDAREGEAMLVKAEKEQKLMSYQSSLEWAKKAIGKLEEKKKEYSEAVEAIAGVKAAIDAALAEGLAIGKAREKLDEANASLKKMEYLAVIERAKECSAEINVVREAKASAEKAIDEAAKVIADAQANNVDVSAADKALGLARNALAASNYSNANDTAKKAKTDAEIRLKASKGANEEIAKARKCIEEIMEAGGDAAKVTEALAQAQTTLKGGDILKAYELAKGCSDRAAKQKQAMGYVKDCKARIDALQQKGTDVSKLSNVLWLADSFMRKGEYDKVINYAQKLEKLIENLEKH